MSLGTLDQYPATLVPSEPGAVVDRMLELGFDYDRPHSPQFERLRGEVGVSPTRMRAALEQIKGPRHKNRTAEQTVEEMEHLGFDHREPKAPQYKFIAPRMGVGWQALDRAYRAYVRQLRAE